MNSIWILKVMVLNISLFAYVKVAISSRLHTFIHSSGVESHDHSDHTNEST